MKIFIFLLAVLACQAYAAPSALLSKHSNSILKTLQSKKTADLIVSIKQNNVSELRKQFAIQSFASRAQKLNAFYTLLKNHADTSQANILNKLNTIQSEKPIVVKQLWITNEIIIKNADYSVVNHLLEMEDVAGVRESKDIPLEKPLKIVVHPEGYVPTADATWGVPAIHAPEAWKSGSNGTGAVVANIDTGVRYTHEALIEGYRSDYGWLDPYDGTETPNDQDGHGTHTAGTIAGRKNNIGVAPGVQWISCKGCGTDTCKDFALLECGQFMACPTDSNGENPDCSKAPNAVSNSWGGNQGDSFYNEVIASWKVLNIAPVFAIGNDGRTGCMTANSPGDSIDAIGVGATNIKNKITDFSSRGPTVRGLRIKPDIAAPGEEIVSSYHLSDTAYSTISGTSMACPHAAGLTGLLYGENPKLTYDQVRNALLAGGQPTDSIGANCGTVSEDKYPNHMVGYGRIDAIASLTSIKGL